MCYASCCRSAVILVSSVAAELLPVDVFVVVFGIDDSVENVDVFCGGDCDDGSDCCCCC